MALSTNARTVFIKLCPVAPNNSVYVQQKNEVKRVIIGGCISSFLTWCLNEPTGRFANEPITVN